MTNADQAGSVRSVAAVAENPPPAAAPKKRKAGGRPFKPGQSGNPGGRPKGLAASVREQVPADQLTRHFRAIFHYDVKELKKLKIELSDVTLDERSKAGQWLADRGYGKAPIHSPVEGGDPLELSSSDRVIADTLDELAGRRQTQAPRGGEGEAVAGAGT